MRSASGEIGSKTERQRDECFPSRALVPAFLNSPARLLAVLGGFFAMHVLLRVMTSPLAVLDESEQIVFSQTLQWGYGPQPPLYTWLQILVFRVVGPSILGLALLKNTLLFAFYTFTYGAARIVTRSHLGGALAALGLLFIPQIVWESQRDLTHSVLATTASVATLYVFLKLHETGTRRWYLALGIVFGLGALSNHTYWLLLAGLLPAALCLKEFRPVIANRWMLLSFSIAVLITAPYAQWIVENWSIVLSTSHKLRIREETPFGLAALQALGNLTVSWFSHIISLLLVFGVLCWKQIVPFPRETLRAPRVRLIVLIIAFALGGVAATMIFTGATSFKGRWLQPLLFSVSITCAAFVQPRIDRRACKAVFGAAFATAAAVMIVLPTRVWLAEKLDRDEPLDRPYASLFNQFRPEIDRADMLVADTHLLAGNLRLLFPDKMVLTPKFAPKEGLARPVSRLAVFFNASFNDNPSPELERLLSRLGKELKHEQLRFVQAARPGGGKPLRLGAAIVE